MADEKKPVPPVETPAEKPETEEDKLNARIQDFIKDYGDLVQKYKVDFATYPMFVPDGNGAFKILTQTTPVDIGNQPIRSEFMRTN